MDKADIKYDIVKECLSKIISYTIWIGSIDLLLVFSFFQKQDKIVIGQFSLPSRHIAIFMFFVLLYFIISLTHKFDRIQGIYTSLDDNNEKINIKTYLNLYPSILNPFAEHDNSERSILFDNLGLGLQTFFYSMGFLMSIKYMVISNIWTLIIFICSFIILVLFRIDLINLVHKTDGVISKENQRLKRLFHYIFLVFTIVVYIILQSI